MESVSRVSGVELNDDEEDFESTCNMPCKSDGAGGDRSGGGAPVDVVLLDAEIRYVLENEELKSEEKWIHYHLIVERYLYKKDPSFKPGQFKFKSQVDETGRVTYMLKGPKWYQRRHWKRCRYLPSLVGPVLGAFCSVWFRTREWCCLL
jgi:hypothetical protein